MEAKEKVREPDVQVLNDAMDIILKRRLDYNVKYLDNDRYITLSLPKVKDKEVFDASFITDFISVGCHLHEIEPITRGKGLLVTFIVPNK